GGSRRRRRRRRRLPDPRGRLPVLPRRDHEAPRPDGRLGTARRVHARRVRQDPRLMADDWRIRIELEEEHAPGLLERLGFELSDEASELAQELAKQRLAVSSDDDEVFVYAGSHTEAESARAVIEAELRDLAVDATVGPVEHWLEDEERWDDEPPDETW